MSIQNEIKRVLYSGDRINSDDLYNKIQIYDYVSFDIFDTLVKRNVDNPSDIFSIIEHTVGGGFKDKRIEAERRARSELGKVEVTIDDIYSFFPAYVRDQYKTFEIETEINAIVPNIPVVEVFKKCIDSGKIVYITSDMYWSEDAIISLLERNGVTGYKALYLSSKEQKVKSDASLFNYLLSKEEISPQKLVHIGDSYGGDFLKPRKLGINAIIIPRYYKNIKFRGDDRNKRIELNYLNHFINNTFIYTENPYYQIGYSQFGKLLYGYVNWIHDEAVKRDIKKIFFFARDGYIMKQAYEACIDDEAISTEYLEVSRRSLRGPILWMNWSYEDVLRMLVNTKLVSLVSIFDGLGLDIERYLIKIQNYGFSKESVFDRKDIYNNESLRILIEDIRPDIINNSKQEFDLLNEYLRNMQVEGKFGVVDIGYGGSMQSFLQQVLTKLGIEHDICGFYLAVSDFYTKNVVPGMKLDLNGYLFDFMHDKDVIDTRSSFVGLFESLFLERAGSVKCYVRDDKGVIVGRYPYEYEIDGKESDDLQKIRGIQKGALDFVNKAADDELLFNLRCTPDELFYGLHEIGANPTLEELRLLGDIMFYDEGVTEKLAAPKSIVRYLLCPKQLKADFLNCRWKTGFMKRLIKIKLPYEKIYFKLRKMR